MRPLRNLQFYSGKFSIMAKSIKPLLFAVGGAHLDRRGQSLVPFVPGASNPGIMREEPGGGVFNTLRLVTQRGIQAEILSVRGADSAGDMVASAIEAAGIKDSSVVFMDRPTPSYTAILDERGDVVAAIADMALYELALPKQLRRRKVRDAIASASAIFCDANLPPEGLKRVADLAGDLPVFALAISPAKAVRLRSVFPNLACLFMNRREALALTELEQNASLPEILAALRNRGLRGGTITNGEGPILAFYGESAFTIQPPSVPGIADVTGAGDAMAGGVIAALMRGETFQQACREGMAAALLTLQIHSASPQFSTREFEQALAHIPAASPLA
ncbi:carbohydrate kinase family protein [Phyllobacterium sp. YR531]|uniref:carbohydrate kinase family protein n=1 Tax=Phyllobacterium sp. YR531 TaxID=1144343 RepID=UPI00026FAA80|nr:carbohydrate kinase family protein [Phyllobacterium sp. YR531]EJM98120.1 sugar kinase, ribokinase [Phyllobacterium sp. YR531]